MQLSHRKYTSIPDFLQDQPEKSKEKTLYDVIHYCGYKPLFKPYKFGNGITFLMPLDATLLKSILDLYNNDKLEELERVFKSLLITFNVKNIADFGNKKDDLSNKNGESIEVKDIKGDTVTLANGATIKPYTAFKSGKTGISIFALEGGSLPLSGPASTHKYDKAQLSSSKAKKGGCSDMRNLDMFAREIEIKYFLCARKAKMSNGGKLTENPYLEVVSSFLDYLKAKNTPQTMLEFNVIMSMIDTSPENSFYLIFEPYGGNRIVSDETLNGFVKAANHSVSIFKNIYNNDIAVANRGEIMAEVDRIRNSILTSNTKASIMKAIYEAYQDLQQNNRIGSAKVFNDDVHKAIAHKKMWQDTLRFFLRRSISSFWNIAGDPTIDDFMQNVVYCVHERVPGRNHAEEMMCKAGESCANVGDDVFYTLYRDFVRSDYFLYIPLNEAEMSARPDKEYGGPEKNTLIRYALYEYERINHYNESERKELINNYVRSAIKMKVGSDAKYNQIMQLIESQ
jgi:hypothetical protein